MQYHYETRGVCSRAIDINLDEATGIIRNVQFTGGCNGNTKGLSAMVVGQPAEEVIRRLRHAPHQLPRSAGGSPDRSSGADLRLRRRIEEREESA